MLSAKHHLFYWGASVTAAIVYHGIASTGCDLRLFRGLLYPLLGYALYNLCLGPRAFSHRQTAPNRAATACLMVCLGVVAEDWSSKKDHLGLYTREMAHAMLAFSALATSEAIRENRTDIAQAHLLTVFSTRTPAPKPYFAAFIFHLAYHLAFLTILFPLLAILNTALDKINGPEVTCASIWQSQMDSEASTLGGAVVFYFIVGYLLDTAETIFLFVYQYWFPVPAPRPQSVSPGFLTPLTLDIVLSLVLWVFWYSSGSASGLALPFLYWKLPL